MTMSSHMLVAAAATALLALLPAVTVAGPRSHIYAGVSAGQADWPIVTGADVLVHSGPFSIQGEFSIFTLGLGASYHLPVDPGGRVDLFTTADYRAFTDLNGVDQGMGFGGGAVFWPTRHVGFRLDSFRFVALQDQIRGSHHHWGARAAIAISFRGPRRTAAGPNALGTRRTRLPGVEAPAPGSGSRSRENPYASAGISASPYVPGNRHGRCSAPSAG